MRVKVGDKWFEAVAGQPLQIELTLADRRNISNMAEEATLYASFADDDPLTRDEKLRWMAEGSTEHAAG